ncbi:hypothetical protein JOF53_006512 [Crossiella equi]|uniref:Uncharacterized protein n=1 Tax=Crossiella equi TaxID=130796 RepID=A0ABS5APN9_9PSEU|nr:hypothetical protein [Crossiella equi]MBP2477640.1 hypothetical protein [Crossiella equi]
MAGRKIIDPGCPVRGGYVHVHAEEDHFTLRAAPAEQYLLAQIAVPAEIHEPGQAWVATLPLADLLTKRPPAATDLQVTAEPSAGWIEVAYRTTSGRVIRRRRAAALAVDESNSPAEVTLSEEAIVSILLSADQVATLVGQVRQHEERDRPRMVWLTLESSPIPQLRLEARITDVEATACDFPLPVAPAGIEVTETYGQLFGRAVARIGKVLDKAGETRASMEIHELPSGPACEQRLGLLFRAVPYLFVLPLNKANTEGTIKRIRFLRTMFTAPSAVSVEVDGEGGLVSQICTESTGALRLPRVVLDFYDRDGEQVLLVHVTDESISEGGTGEVYSGVHAVTMSRPLNHRIVVDHRVLGAALTVFRRQDRVLLHLDPEDSVGSQMIGISAALQDGARITEFQAADVRTLFTRITSTPERVALYAESGPIPQL